MLDDPHPKKMKMPLAATAVFERARRGGRA